MGQIVSSAAKPKRCNIRQLSQLGTPAAGEHILVSSDNSMNAAGQGNLDCYIVGDGTTAATSLPLLSTADNAPAKGSLNSIQSSAVQNVIDDFVDQLGHQQMSQIILNWESGTYYKSDGTKGSNVNYSSATFNAEGYRCETLYFILHSETANIYLLQKDYNGNILYSLKLDSSTTYPLPMLVDRKAATICVSNKSANGVGYAYLYTKEIGSISVKEDIENLEMPQRLPTTWNDGVYYIADVPTTYSSENWSSLSVDASLYAGKRLYLHLYGQTNGIARCVMRDYYNTVDLWINDLQQAEQNIVLNIPPNAGMLYISNRIASGTGFVGVYSTEGTKDYIESLTSDSYDALKNKKISIIGDSITYGTGASGNDYRYTDIFANKVGATINNLGVVGTTIADGGSGYSDNRFVTRATSANLSDSDLVIVFGGTNDFTKDVKDIGELFSESTITTTTYRGNKELVAPSDVDAFGGALHNLINTIRTNAPNVPIIFITPIQRGVFTSNTDQPTSHQSNRHGKYMSDYVDAIIRICSFYSIPVLNLYAISQLDFTNATIAANYSVDNLHPNDKGHRIIADLLYSFVKVNIIELVK